MRGSRIIGAFGRTLIAAGVLLLLFVAYQLWGTGLREAQAQDDLRDRFEQSLAATTTTTPPPTAGTTGSEVTQPPRPAPAPAPPPPPTGQPVATVRIPRIGVDKVGVEGVSVADRKKGPGHYPGTPMPGQAGNAAIAGHRTTYGAPFYDLDKLQPGDPIDVTTAQGEFRYEVVETKIVAPSQVEVLEPTGDNRLTLTTCNPRFSARERLIVVARLVGEPAPGGGQGTLGSIPIPDGDGDGSDVPVVASAEPEPAVQEPVAFEDDALSGDPAARTPTVLWGALAALVWLATWGLSRQWRRWPSYLVGTPVFLAVLFTFYENVARLFPANI